ncbi:hypothetical protein KRR55_05245 [Paeniglutamicibacter sp. ABSL32-1]|uniref:hypothetical protein n=1 Tax=Paeniglutamicibacter quisquiliarum TaxID=2849498 RepID=UPI001C2D651D|nr:hypothetical protein [Paeniglutamicibacter quisquiliarum]MBV1778520.1 hypothetical protein [Paeniglutamicibacter quisquiliarum]
MKKMTLAASLLIGALGLAGCTTAEPTPDPDTAKRQAWADQKINQWLSANNSQNLDQMGDPFDLVKSWESPEEGKLVVYVDFNENGVVDLNMVSNNIVRSVRHMDDDLLSVEAVNGAGLGITNPGSISTYPRPD